MQQAGARGLPPLKVENIGKFEPKQKPDAAAAIRFIDGFKDAVRHYGQNRVLPLLRSCCTNDTAMDWRTGLHDADQETLAASTAGWETLIHRDFMPRQGILATAARAETFRWTQNRTPSDYVTHKAKLFRMAGETDQNLIVNEIHNGFAECPEMHMLLEQAVRDTDDNSIAAYDRAVQRIQDSGKLQYESRRAKTGSYGSSYTGSYGSSYAARARENLPAISTSKASCNTRSQPSKPAPAGAPPRGAPRRERERKPFPRKRKCRNYPNCVYGEHYDWECTWKGTTADEKRAYYILPETSDELDDNTLQWEFLDEQPDMEDEYELDQHAYFAHKWKASSAFFADHPNHQRQHRQPTLASPKPSECRTCLEAFPSRTRLHAHLMATGHNRAPSSPGKPLYDVIRSTCIAPANPEMRLASYHYSKARFMLRPGDTTTHMACFDPGYGNSAVDEAFIQAHVPDPTYHQLQIPKEVHGIGGGVALCTKLLMLKVFYLTMDGRYAEITRPFHVLPDLGVELLCGIDTIREEGIDIYYSSTIPQMRIASCQGAAIAIDVYDGEKVHKIPVRTLEKTVIPANSTAVIAIKTPRELPPNQDYLFTPSRLRSVTSSGAGAPHAVFSHDQKNVLFTNLQDTDTTMYANTVIGHLHSTESEKVAVWHEAAKEVRGFLGFNKIIAALAVAMGFAAATTAYGNSPTADMGFAAETKITFDPESDCSMPTPDDAIPFALEPPRPRPCPVASATLPDAECAQEIWSPPIWLYEEYVPNYEYDLPEGISVPDVSTTTYAQVVINDTDDISPEQVNALRLLVKRHPSLFNDGMGCVREPMTDWMRLPVDREYELKLKPRGPYRLSKQGEEAVDENFDELTSYGRLQEVTKPTPWGLQVFVVYKTAKKRPVIDMRRLNDGLAGDSYPLPRMESVIEPLQGMKWLGTVDITSAFYQRLLHPDDRHRATVVTHRGVEQFATTVMGCKNSVQHQQKLMDRRVLSKLSWTGASCYVDDIVIYAETFQKFLQMTDEVFCILSDLGITLKARKCYLGFHSIELLGYLVDRLGLTTTESKSDAVKMIPFPATLSQLEYFIGLTNWNRHLIPYYAQRVAPLQECKTSLLKNAPQTKRARKLYAAKTPVPKDETLVKAYEDLRDTLAARPRLHHLQDGKPIYAFLDSSRAYGTGLAVYQLTGDVTDMLTKDQIRGTSENW
jgi:hypothetical protein